MKHQNQTIISIISIIAVFSLACQCALPAMFTGEPTPAPTATPEGEPLPPQVVYVSPGRGEEQQLDAPVQFVFDQAMDADSVEDAFSIEPKVSGDFNWVTDRVVQFEPRKGFDRAERYIVTIEDEARSAHGERLRDEFQYRFTTVGFLEVASVYPDDGTEEVAIDGTVTVLFNRPVVPLVAIENQDTLPQPLAFDPPVEGTGEWVNTSIYVFTPAEGFAPATTYEARVAAGLEDTTGGVLEEDFTWEFTTVMPAVVATYPDRGTVYVSTEPTVYVAFNQKMDRASVEAAFELASVRTGGTVAGTFEWHDAGLILPDRETYEPYSWSWDSGVGPERVGVETVGFTPSEPLAFGARYQVTIGAGAQGATGGAGAFKKYSAAFDIIAYPSVVHTSPADGADDVDPDSGLQVSFSSPMDPDSFAGKIFISPPVSVTDVYTYWWDSNTDLNISFPVQPNADYAVTISGDVQGRYGHELGEDVTVRWHTKSLGPMAYLNTMGKVGTYNAYSETVAYVTVRNVGQVNFGLYRMSAGDFITAYEQWSYWDEYRGKEGNLVRSWSMDVAPLLDKRAIYGTRLSESGFLEPGIYYLEVSAPSSAIYPEARSYSTPELHKQILIVSRYSLTLKKSMSGVLAWVTDLRSGDVVPGVDVTALRSGRVLADGTTDQDGVFVGEYTGTDRWESVYVFTGDRNNPGEDFCAGITGWSNGISAWDFDLPVAYYEEPYTAYFFTERPIYRPGQTVYFKGILRGDDDAHYSLPPKGKLQVTIWDAQATEVYNEELPISDMGTMEGELELGEEASLGSYSLQVNYKDSYYGTSFLVAEYRVPEFQVEVQTDAAEYVQGDEINATAQATYFFGGAVADAKVRYAMLSADTYFNYTGGGWWDFTDADYSSWWDWYGQRSSYGELITEGEGVTDAEGRFTFSVDADIAEKVNSQRFTLEVTVTDINDQEVSNRTEALVHKGTYYIGLQPERYVGRVGDDVGVNVITVDWASEPAPNKELTVVFSEHNWYSVRKQAEDGRYYWESVVEDTPVYTTTATTDAKGKASASFVPEKGGVYKATAIGQDERRNEVRSSTYMWVSGRAYVSWRMDNNDRIDLVTDKRQYQVGDTATILIPHTYQGEVQALVTIERGSVYDYWVETLETNSEQLQIPITEEMIPNVYVSVVIVKGVDESNPYPSFKVGYARLSIETTEKELTIEMTPDKGPDEHYGPGDEVSYDIQVTDSAGKPVQAELALSLVDLAVLTLADRRQPDIVSHFWRERGIGVDTASSLVLSIDRISLEVGEEVKGMGGGGGGEEFGPVRKDFRDTAYWDAVVTTGEDGKAQVSADLPDNLTTWRMSAWGVTAETLVGESQVDVVSTKDLLVRPVAPRFFIVGDEALLAAVVHNNTEDDLEVTVSFEADGLQVGKSASEQVVIPAGDKVKVEWPVVVEDVSEVKLLFGAKSSLYADAVEIPLPVYRYSTPEVVATSGVIKSDGERLEAVALPPSFDPTQGELAVQVEPSLAAGMIDGLDYLEHYPYECTEQTVSRFLPNVVTYRAYKELGLDRPDLATKLPGQVSVGLQRLYHRQRYDGGWGWWLNDDSNPYLTAYVMLGLIEAQRAGFTVDEEVVRQAANYLKGSLQDTRDVKQHWEANRRAFILYVLAEAERPDTSRMVTLFEKRDMLDTFGKAYLAMGFGLLGEDYQKNVDTLLSDITGEAIVSATGAHWEEAQPDYYAMNTDTRSTAIVLAALSRLNSGHALAPNAVRWLMAVRKDGYWDTTQETAWSLIALTDWMVATGELEGAYDWQVVVNGETLGEGSVARKNIDESVKLQIAVAELLSDQANRVVVERSAPEGERYGDGVLYYSMYLRTYKPVEEVTALNRGIIVSRQYTLSDCDPEEEKCPMISQAQVGDVIRVKLTIITPNDAHYVVVEDPFPAGAEGVDQSLKTTSVVGEEPTLTRTDRVSPWGGYYGWWWFSHTEIRDEKAVLFATYLPRGTYEYTYLIRASLAGEYRVIPTHAYEMYFPEVFGRSDGGVFTIVEALDE
ncbi:MAG: Ig-like domain-containing protein [Anaerolineae bacterium]|nr:Ig-like domain-containing protein [Anaerolineae bacterium]